MQLMEKLRALTEAHAATYFGVADLARARQFVDEQSGGLLADFPLAIAFGMALPHAIVDMLPRREEYAVRVSYRTHAYSIVSDRLDRLASAAASIIQSSGFRAFPVPAAERIDDVRISAVFSHKLAAHCAGLGWIGKSCLLVTPDNGPRVRWVSVLTDASLAPTGDSQAPQCGECSACVDICPAHAFTGRAFSPEEAREARFDARACERYFESIKDPVAPGVCGLCLYACPYGRAAGKRLDGGVR